jgi:hypothetical protein
MDRDTIIFLGKMFGGISLCFWSLFFLANLFQRSGEMLIRSLQHSIET